MGRLGHVRRRGVAAEVRAGLAGLADLAVPPTGIVKVNRCLRPRRCRWSARAGMQKILSVVVAVGAIRAEEADDFCATRHLRGRCRAPPRSPLPRDSGGAL